MISMNGSSDKKNTMLIRAIIKTDIVIRRILILTDAVHCRDIRRVDIPPGLRHSAYISLHYSLTVRYHVAHPLAASRAPSPPPPLWAHNI